VYPQKTQDTNPQPVTRTRAISCTGSHQHGVSVEVMAMQLLTNSLSLKQKQTEAVNLLQSWIDNEDESEQKETGHYLIHALDEDRLCDRKLFPPEMKGFTW
jgi:hypothetical protein